MKSTHYTYISLLEIRFQRPWVQMLHLTEENNLSPFDSKTVCLCWRIEINNNKHVYRQSQVRKPTVSGVEWALCSLFTGTGYWWRFDSRDLLSNPAFSRGRQPVSLWLKLHEVPKKSLWTWNFFTVFLSSILCNPLWMPNPYQLRTLVPIPFSLYLKHLLFKMLSELGTQIAPRFFICTCLTRLFIRFCSI